MAKCLKEALINTRINFVCASKSPPQYNQILNIFDILPSTLSHYSQIMHGFLPAALLYLIHFTPISIGAPMAVPAPTALPLDTLPSLEAPDIPLEAREPTKVKPQAHRAKPALGQPTDYAHVDLEGMIGDLTMPSSETKSNSSSTSTASETTSTKTKSTKTKATASKQH